MLVVPHLAIFAIRDKMKYFLLLLASVLVLSCFEKGDCSDVSSNVMQLNFYSDSDKKAKTILIDSIKMVGWDTVMYKNKSVATVKLPLDPSVNSMTYKFYYDNTIATLEVAYVSRSYALAPDCKAIDIITLLDATVTAIQDIIIFRPELTSNAAENIKLYF